MRGRKLGLSMAVLEAAMATALAVTLGGCSPKAQTVEQPAVKAEPIKIGAIVSLTGTYAGLGDPEKKTIEMEVARINEAGGINGRPVEVIFEDDATDEAKAVTAATRLIDQDGVIALIGATGSGQTMAVRGEVDRAKIPQVSLAGATAITKIFDPLVFATPWSNTIVAPFTLEALKKAGLTKVGLITDSGGFGKDGREVVKAEAAKQGIDIVSDQTFNPGDTDMTAQLTKIKNSGAQVLLMWTAGAEAATIVKSADQLGLDMPVYGSHGNARKELIDGAGPAAEGFRFAAGKILVPAAYGVDTDAYKVATDFVTRYKAAYGDAPSTFAGHAYDALYLITEAASRVQGDLTPAALRDEIEKTNGFVGIGGTFTMSPTDHNGLSVNDLTMYEVKDGTWQTVK
ncbi:MAG: ABC transporter substrate-binding protein [Actinobacteria bacterium HGW-Actinobacteria-7]|jgi:branched-chain amino acid transport system substrate-binding protein|nr:MAG: ABC transporter substrate-binding protein [Actinobacteria bacterium HGW-Actinobacteria-7]